MTYTASTRKETKEYFEKAKSAYEKLIKYGDGYNAKEYADEMAKLENVVKVMEKLVQEDQARRRNLAAGDLGQGRRSAKAAAQRQQAVTGEPVTQKPVTQGEFEHAASELKKTLSARSGSRYYNLQNVKHAASELRKTLNVPPPGTKKGGMRRRWRTKKKRSKLKRG